MGQSSNIDNGRNLGGHSGGIGVSHHKLTAPPFGQPALCRRAFASSTPVRF